MMCHTVALVEAFGAYKLSGLFGHRFDLLEARQRRGSRFFEIYVEPGAAKRCGDQS